MQAFDPGSVAVDVHPAHAAAREPTVFHPPGTVRLVTPAEEAAMARQRRCAAPRPPAPGPRRMPRSITPDRHEPVGLPEEFSMANMSVRLAYPAPRPRPEAPATPARGLAARFRRVLHAALRAIDAAPFDLAWPPTVRHWPAPVTPTESDQPAVDRTTGVTRPALRRAA